MSYADYDAVSLSPMPDAPLDFHQTLFPVSNQSIFQGAQKLAAQLRQKKAFTNTSTFDLKCQVRPAVVDTTGLLSDWAGFVMNSVVDKASRARRKLGLTLNRLDMLSSGSIDILNQRSDIDHLDTQRETSVLSLAAGATVV